MHPLTATVVCCWPDAPLFSLCQAKCLSPPPPCRFSLDKAYTFFFLTLTTKCPTDTLTTEAQDSCQY